MIVGSTGRRYVSHEEFFIHEFVYEQLHPGSVSQAVYTVASLDQLLCVIDFSIAIYRSHHR
jgi:hypothetical protein